MQVKLKYKLFGEFDDFEIAEIAEWIKVTMDELSIDKLGTLKLTIDYEPKNDV